MQSTSRQHLEYHSVPTSLNDMLWLLYQWTKGFKNCKLYATRMVASRNGKQIIPWWSTPISGNYGFTDVARIFCWSMSQLCSHSWLKDGNGNPLPDELFDLLRRCIAYINKIGNKTVTTPAGFFSRLGSSILEPKWAKDVQQLSAAGVTFGKAAFKLLKSLQTNWTSQPPRICLFTWLFRPKRTIFQQASQASQRHWLFGSSNIWPPRIFTRNPFPFTETSILSPCRPCSRYPISHLQAIHSYPLLSSCLGFGVLLKQRQVDPFIPLLT